MRKASLFVALVAAAAATALVVAQQPSSPAAEKAASTAAKPPAGPAPKLPLDRPIPEEFAEAVARANAAVGQPLPIGTMAELMAKVIYPTSDAILYISSRTPANDEQWNELQGKALMLAESANLIMMPSRALDSKQWMKDAQLMLDAGAAAFEAAKNKDEPALENLNQAVYESCVVCHLHYRPDYGNSPSP